MDEQERVELIRKGNELFNNKNYKEALKIFLKTNYIDGIIRVADYLYYDQKNIISALKLYKKAGYKKMIDLLSEEIANIIKLLLNEDKLQNENENVIHKENIEEMQNIKKWEPVVLKTEDIEKINEE